MTAPDHTPYRVPGDLITAEDVYTWLDNFDPYDIYDAALAMAVPTLRKILDKQRREALRRGCFAHFALARQHRTWERAGFIVDECEPTSRENRADCLRRALAYRAAARQ
jgi:hypothetical protein